MIRVASLLSQSNGIPFLEDIYSRVPEKSIDLTRRTVYFP
jgi:Fe2+ or Zn2+ uptake regulation protein